MKIGSDGRMLRAVAWLRGSSIARAGKWAASFIDRYVRAGAAMLGATVTYAEAKRVFAALPDWIDQLRKLVASAAMVGGIVVGAWIIVDLSSNEPLVFDDLNVQAALADRVPKGGYLAQRVGAYFDQVTADIERFKEINTSASKPDAELPKLEIPGAQISVQAVVQIVRRFLGFRERRIGGDVFLSEVPLEPLSAGSGPADGPACPDNGRPVYVVIRLSVDRTDLAEPVEVRICRHKSPDDKSEILRLDTHVLEGLLQVATLRAYERLNPCGSATYYFNNWYRLSVDGRPVDPASRRAKHMVSACLAANGADVAAYSYVMLGRIHQFFAGRPEEAVDFFEAAENVHLSKYLFWRRFLHAHDLWWIRFPHDFYAHWGAALMDAQRAAAALGKFELQIKYNPRSIKGYIGKGNALATLARPKKEIPLDNTKVAAALAVYCDAAREHRFDPEIRYYLANFLEEYSGSVTGCQDRTGGEDRSDARSYALTQRRKSVDLAPTNPKYGLALGRALSAAGRHEEAIAAFNQVLDFNGQGDWDTYVELAKIFAERKEGENVDATYQRAFDILSVVAAQRPADVTVRYHVALASLKLEKFKMAEQYAREAKMLAPSQWDVRVALLCAQWRLGKTKEAREELGVVRRLVTGSEKAQLTASKKAESLGDSLRTCVAEVERSIVAKTP